MPTGQYDRSRTLTPEERRARAAERMRRVRARKKAEDPDLVFGREYELRRKFGLGSADYEKLLAAQGGRCAICKTDDPGRQSRHKRHFFVDHDHVTGRVRGLLCSACNLGLGQLGDTVEQLENAAAYLRRAA